ncbi:hypothetical protein CEXT_632671 [Caerostris extrusa]|uniref:Uncharacterized protein n=1 Tax=Caerostris extrusa TaxID=172846 RepID=A0AAV4VUY6_CAEEX|nr:hypothetical protein CEXT_632671 [Caerostris extrusa]
MTIAEDILSRGKDKVETYFYLLNSELEDFAGDKLLVLSSMTFSTYFSPSSHFKAPSLILIYSQGWLIPEVTDLVFQIPIRPVALSSSERASFGTTYRT